MNTEWKKREVRQERKRKLNTRTTESHVCTKCVKNEGKRWRAKRRQERYSEYTCSSSDRLKGRSVFEIESCPTETIVRPSSGKVDDGDGLFKPFETGSITVIVYTIVWLYHHCFLSIHESVFRCKTEILYTHYADCVGGTKWVCSLILDTSLSLSLYISLEYVGWKLRG